jgi:hypothetical protein
MGTVIQFPQREGTEVIRFGEIEPPVISMIIVLSK